MDEGLCSHLLGCPDDEVAACNVVSADSLVGGSFDDVGVLVRLSGKQQNVGSLFTDALESFSSARDGLVHDNGLHERVIRETDYLGNSGFLFRCEVVRVRERCDHAAIGDIAVLLDKALSTPEVVLGLRNGPGDYTDVVLRARVPARLLSRLAAGKQHANQHERQQHS